MAGFNGKASLLIELEAKADEIKRRKKFIEIFNWKVNHVKRVLMLHTGDTWYYFPLPMNKKMQAEG